MIRLLALAVFLPVANAHGFLSFPAAVYQDPYTATSFVTTITESINPSVFGGRKWNDSPELNAATFASAFHRSNFSSLREIVDLVVFDCGNTKGNIPPVDVTGATEARWQNNEEHKGFVESHHGPCEVWIDDRLALHDDDCRASFTTYPAHLPVSYNTLCKGKCQLTFFWLALHEPTWQVYKACVPIVTKDI